MGEVDNETSFIEICFKNFKLLGISWAKEVGFFDALYLPLCQQDYRNTTGPNFMKLGGRSKQRKNPLHLRADPNHGANTQIIFYFHEHCKIGPLALVEKIPYILKSSRLTGPKHRHHITINIHSRKHVVAQTSANGAKIICENDI